VDLVTIHQQVTLRPERERERLESRSEERKREKQGDERRETSE
jgi:hypothetical protein